MKLTGFKINNYRSIKSLEVEVIELADGSKTFGLIGINEAGKSSILRALAINSQTPLVPNGYDFNDPKSPIEVIHQYELTKNDLKECKNLILTSDPKFDLKGVDYSFVELKFAINPENVNKSLKYVSLIEVDDSDDRCYRISKIITSYVVKESFTSIFWKAEDKFLINQPINYEQFANNPNGISLPLANCFKLANIEDIKGRIQLLKDSTERELLEEELGEAVTNHINRIWTKHPIKISFNISDGHLNFHVKDLNARGKAKTANQRSDGFRQFISFLLSVSAQYLNGEVNNTILLLDEPETHLHPKAQEDLLKELIKITKPLNSNVVLFATHSNYMIDKNHLERNIRVEKNNGETELILFDKNTATYASVNYDVFDIISTDYHNELYGRAQVLSGLKPSDFDKKIKELLPNCTIKEGYVHSNGNKFDCTLPTYIRHKIHHPENKANENYTPRELERSIKNLLKVIKSLKS